MSRRRPVGTRKRRDANIHTHTHQAMSRVSPGANPSSSVSVRHSASSHHPSMMRPRRAVCRDGGADGQGRGMAQRALLQRRMQRTSHAAPRRLASGQLLARASLQAPLRLCQERLLAKRIVTTCPSPLHRHSPEQKIGARPAQCARVDTYAQSTRSPQSLNPLRRWGVGQGGRRKMNCGTFVNFFFAGFACQSVMVPHQLP